jgi:hypothetical protein
MASRKWTIGLAPLFAALGVACMSWLGLYGYAWNDYENEALPAMQALVHGHFAKFAELAPSYGGSLLLRAPFALLPGLWGGGPLAVYQAVSIACLIAAALLGLWLCGRMRVAGHGRLARGLALGLCVANPITLPALELGHADELLNGALCVAAVMIAATEIQAPRRRALDPRALCAGLLLGLAIGSKEWALIAVGPALLALRGGRVQLLIAIAAGAAVLIAPIALLSSSFVSATSASASTASTIFQPWQIFWFIGRHGPVVHGLFGNPKRGYRTAPSWVGPISHPLVLLAGITPPAAIWWQRRERAAGALMKSLRSAQPLPTADALQLLALVCLLRCLLDTWDNVYYTLPLLLSLLAWEVTAFKRAPAVSLSATALCWISFQWLPSVGSADAQSAFFLAWTVPLAIVLSLRLYGTTVSSFVSLPSTTGPLSFRITRSSIRTPSSPGR